MRRAAATCAAPGTRGLWRPARDYLLGRTRVGEDEVAVYYVSVQHGRSGAGDVQRERRSYEPKPGVDADDVEVPPEWQSWLRGVRALPPSAADSLQLASQRTAVQRKAAELAREETLRRARARVLSDTSSSPADALGGDEAGAQHWTPPPR
jgi:NADH:ubiquinone oxidoreductase subunit